MSLVTNAALYFGLTCLFWSSDASAQTAKRWAIALHGGAGSLSPKDMTPARRKRYETALTEALQIGRGILDQGGNAIEATTKTVVYLEDCELFNAGKGAVFTRKGGHELDASIMEGSTLAGGGVTRVSHLKNPILAARLVMQHTPHVLLSDHGAERLAKEHGLEFVKQSYFFTQRRFESLQEKLDKLELPRLEQPEYGLPDSTYRESSIKAEKRQEQGSAGGTVGCVALDGKGHLAAATSTGGLTGKMPGRIGDSPILGAGNYANGFVAASGTGTGEQFIRYSVTARVAWLVEHTDMSLDAAVEHCLNNVLDPGDGGLIAVDRNGKLVTQFTTDSMPRGIADSSGRFEVAIWPDDLVSEERQSPDS